ncbi:MAG TPA: tetratricopeptide repeat protein [Candidatus Eremiobacteraceae bacterium]|nr:tetratricopeptide repeat protein [Candidatus Eremiobacteraceae bacterium]
METKNASAEFGELLATSARDGVDVPLDHACLLVSAAIDPRTDIRACEATLDELADRASAIASRSREPYAQAGSLLESLFTIGGFSGNTAAYGASSNSLLGRVIATRTGIPITLSIVLMETGRRIGLPLEGVGLPGHFVVRFPDPTSRLFIDPFHAGAIVDERDCRALVERVYGDKLTWRDDFLDSVKPRAILKRLVLNLKNALSTEKNYAAALTAIQLQLEIDPDDPSELRDRGIILARLHRYESAISDLEAYLARRPDADDGEHIRNTVRYLRRATS